MSEVDLTQQLDAAIDTMMATGEMPASADPRIDDLLGIAVELRNLPRAEFKARFSAFPDWREEIVEETGHMLHHDQPERVAALIAQFCA